MEIEDLLEYLNQACESRDISRAEIKAAIEGVLEWLIDPNHKTDENCRKISMFVTTRISSEAIERLPKDIQDLLFDMGAALYDAYSARPISENFYSTPEQLLKRARQRPI